MPQIKTFNMIFICNQKFFVILSLVEGSYYSGIQDPSTTLRMTVRQWQRN